MGQFIIHGGNPLKGTITPSGNKNAALPLLAACLLTDEPVTLHNVPDIHDVLSMRELLESLGATVENRGDHTWRIQARDVNSFRLDTELCKRIRASILLAGPLVARLGSCRLPPPGGDVIGRRRLDTHTLALSRLGARTAYHRAEKEIWFEAESLHGADILLDEVSVTATENAIMAAVTAPGETVIRNAASEPHVQELCNFLCGLGADIRNIGSNTLHITGVNKLGGGTFTIGPDYLEVVSYVGAAVVTGGAVTIRNAGPRYLSMVSQVFRRLGVHWEVRADDLFVPAEQKLEITPDLDNSIPEISVMPWPSFPTDLMSVAIVTATQSRGSVLFHDWMFEGRMYFTDKLKGMGARIVLCDPHRCIVQGPTRLLPANVESPDIRAGLALVLAALAAEGRSVIRNVSQIDRGYEKIDTKLAALGARIERG
jgi:UDP-N-acetylglucosamine 1-carboxyvinyltransferase